MAGRGAQGNRQVRRLRRRDRAIGASASVATFLAFGLTPLTTVPVAQADEFDWIVNLFDPAAWGLDGVPPTLGAADASDLTIGGAAWFEQAVYAPWHDSIQDWITSDFGQTIDGYINDWFGNGQILIGNGVDGTATTAAGDGGLWFGDGGAGFDSTTAGVAGGDGGDAGAGGDVRGANGGDGGTGGDGGNGSGSGSVGGNGGDGGAGGQQGPQGGGDGGTGGNGGSGSNGQTGGSGGDGGDGGADGTPGTPGEAGQNNS